MLSLFIIKHQETSKMYSSIEGNKEKEVLWKFVFLQIL